MIYVNIGGELIPVEHEGLLYVINVVVKNNI